MPEYLAPGVYVEEIDTGNKPIEGVSTSTAGMIGVAERGPVNVPILITSYGEYSRWFGERLNKVAYGEHRYLPHAVEGFFINGGKRVYVTRVLDPSAATPAFRQMVAPDPAAPAMTQLALRAASGASAITVLDATGMGTGTTLQVGAGVGAEFPTVAAGTAANVVALEKPLAYAHDAGQTVELVTVADATPPVDHSSTLAEAAAAGASSITVADAATFDPPLATGNWLHIGAAGTDDEYVQVQAVSGDRITLGAPLSLAHAETSDVVRQTVVLGASSSPIAAGAAAARGESILLVVDNTGLTTPLNFVRIRHPDPMRVEIRRVGQLARVPLDHPSLGDYPTATRVEHIVLAGSIASGTLTADATRSATVIQVSDRTALQVGDILQIAGPDETVEIAALPAMLPAPNPGRVVLRSGLRTDHLATNGLTRFAPPMGIASATAVAVDTVAGSGSIVVGAGNVLAAGGPLRLVTPSGGVSYHVVPPATPLAAQTVSLVSPLQAPQAAGAAVAVRQPMFEVRALDAGIWGNRLRVATEPPPDALLTTRVRGVPPSNTSLRLMSAAGIESGTELLVTDAANNTTAHKVASIDRQNDYLITLDAANPLPLTVTDGDAVRSREHRFVVELMRQPDPANPARNNVPIDREVFAYLSLDPRHSRYFQHIIGATWDMANPTTTHDDNATPRSLRRGDHRSEGESSYVRVNDTSATTDLRSGPVAEYETRPDGTRRLILLPLAHGDDVLGAVTDATYIGNDNTDPELRTGLFILRNIEEISIAACPGRTSVQIQNALINHCELMRYRFVVLDGEPPPNDSMSNIQSQRQQFDTKYAALYHPWLLVPDPYPPSTSTIPDYPIPPSGHVLGIYARTDIERGVHKAPANEVVRGILGLQRVLNKEQHDILNPYPVNINVIRDFRDNNRGIRVFGGRVITSDPDWKYVNVRRLLIFIEASIDRGLQWVVFEPNAEPLWARVRRSISNFLTLVWRNGGLEGTKPEEAYFVKCDRTTMTQTDIDNGRLIVMVGVAPVKPAEFVIIRIGLWTAHAED